MGRRRHLSRGSGFRVGYVCKAVSADHPTVAVQLRWIRALAEHPDVAEVAVFTAERGRGSLPENVHVTVLPDRWPLRAPAFVAQTLVRAAAVDFFLVVQGGPYP